MAPDSARLFSLNQVSKVTPIPARLSRRCSYTFSSPHTFGSASAGISAAHSRT